MVQFAANISFLFKELPFLERFDAAAEAGFEGVEVLFPYEVATSEIVRRIKRSKLKFVSMNAPPPNWTGGARGFAATPGGEDRFRKDFRRAMRFAARLEPHHIHLMAGNAKGPLARATFIDNLLWATDEARDQSLTIGPMNAIDMPEYFLQDFGNACEIINDVGAKNLSLQFDTYHAHMLNHDVLGTWESCKRYVRHVLVGNAPTRDEPKQGDIPFDRFFEALRKSGFKGHVSGAYDPAGRTIEGLDWLKF